MKNNFYSTIMCALVGIMMTMAYLPAFSQSIDVNDLRNGQLHYRQLGSYA